MPNSDFYPIELWKQFEPELKWRVEKPGRVVVMDGQQTVLYIKTANEAVKFLQPSPSAFDTDWLHRIANLSNTISNELRLAQAQGWKLDLAEETAADGRLKSIVTVHAKCGLPDDDYRRNKFFHDADTRRVYRFDAQTERLEAVQIYLVRSTGEVQIFDLSQIDYDQPIDPSVWQLDLPADVSWYQEPQEAARQREVRLHDRGAGRPRLLRGLRQGGLDRGGEVHVARHRAIEGLPRRAGDRQPGPSLHVQVIRRPVRPLRNQVQERQG